MMKFRAMIDSDWEQFAFFAENNFVSSHPVNRTFMDFWFRKSDGSWSIQLGFRDDGTISAVNMMIDVPGRFIDHKTPLTWMSTSLAESDAQAHGLGGQMLFHSHRILPFICCTCANQNSLPINDALGLAFPELRLRRFVYMLTPKCLQIVQDNCQMQVETLFTENQFIDPHDNSIKKTWVENIPRDFNELWVVFSKDLNCVVERDLEYMQRRYLEAPYQQYHILEVRSDDHELRGLTIVRFQATSFGTCARIVDFIATPDSEFDVWCHTLHACNEKEALYADFFVMGTGQDKNLLETGFVLETDDNCIASIPNLLSPIDYRRWSYTFHVSGNLPHDVDDWMDPKKIWFTKGDGDRDWPTAQTILSKC